QRDTQARCTTKFTVEATAPGYVPSDAPARRCEADAEGSATLIFKYANAASDRYLTRLVVVTDIASCHRKRDTATLFIFHIRNAIVNRVDAIVKRENAARSEDAGSKVAKNVARDEVSRANLRCSAEARRNARCRVTIDRGAENHLVRARRHGAMSKR